MEDFNIHPDYDQFVDIEENSSIAVNYHIQKKVPLIKSNLIKSNLIKKRKIDELSKTHENLNEIHLNLNEEGKRYKFSPLNILILIIDFFCFADEE